MTLSKFIGSNNVKLENLRIREKCMRTLQYGLLIVADFVKSDSKILRKKALEEISGQLGLARALLRCFDDLSMLHCTLSYGWGSHEKNLIVRVLNLIENGSGLLYYPVEHFALGQDMGLFLGDSRRAWRIGLILWLISLISCLTRCLMKRSKLKMKLGYTKEMDEKRSLNAMVRQENVNLLMFSADFLNALNWLSFRPWGGGPFSSWVVGLLGLVSSLAALHNLVR